MPSTEELLSLHGGAQSSASSSMPPPSSAPSTSRSRPPTNTQSLISSQKIPRQSIEDAVPEEVRKLRGLPFQKVYDEYLTPRQQDAYDEFITLPRYLKNNEGDFVYDMENFNPYMEMSPTRETPEQVENRLQRYYRKRAEIDVLHSDGQFFPAMDETSGNFIPRPRTAEEQERFEAEEAIETTDDAPTKKENQYRMMLSKDWSHKFSAPLYKSLQAIRDPSSPVRTNSDGPVDYPRSLEETWALMIESMKADAYEESAYETTPEGKRVRRVFKSAFSTQFAESIGMPELAQDTEVRPTAIMASVLEQVGPEKGLTFLEGMANLSEASGGIADHVYEGMISLDELSGGIEKIGVDIPGVGEFYPFRNLNVESNARRAVGFLVDAVDVADFIGIAAIPNFALRAAKAPVKAAIRMSKEAEANAKERSRRFKEQAAEAEAGNNVRNAQRQTRGMGVPTATGIPIFDEAIDAGRTAVEVKLEKSRVLKDMETREAFAENPELGEVARAKIEASRIYVSHMRGATQENLAVKAALAKEVADKNEELREQLLKDFEVLTGKEVTSEKTIMPETEFVDGKEMPIGEPVTRRVYDPKKARQAGLELTEEVNKLETLVIGAKTPDEFVVSDSDVAKLATGQDAMTHPILNPDKLDAVVAIASDFKKAYPKKDGANIFWDDNDTVIDNLFRLTVTEDLTGINSPSLMNMLGAYGLNFEDYVLTVIGSGSQAGKILQKFSQIQRARPKSDQQKRNEKELEMANSAHSNFIRTVNITRAALVSMFRTAMRNLETGVIRSPFEAQANAIDNVIWRTQNEGFASGGKEFVSWDNWRDSFRSFKYIYSDPESAKELTDFLLKNPQMMHQWSRMFDNINEIQQASGRGRGGVMDAILSEAEDIVTNMNLQNRWQEYLIRRGILLGDLERLVRREWGVDYLDELNKGKLYDFINDNPDLKPDGARSYEEIVSEAVEHSLKYTFASQPDLAFFRGISSFMTRSGLTLFEHFPRFVFNQAELLARYAGGGTGLVALRQIRRGIQHVQGKEVIEALTPKDRRRLGDNLSGLMMIGAAYGYITAEDDEGKPLAPADYKKAKLTDGTVVDLTPQSPMRQIMFLARFLKELRDNSESGNLFELSKYSIDEKEFNPYAAISPDKDNESAFFDSRAWRGALKWFMMPEQRKNFLETFLVSRTGLPSDLFKSVAEFTLLPTNVSADDFENNERFAEKIGRWVGNYLRKNVTWFAQFFDIERGLGLRTSEKKDFAIDPVYGDMERTLVDNIKRPFRQAGLVDPDEELALPARERLYQEPGVTQRRHSPLGTALLGVGVDDADSEAGEYLMGLGFGEYWGGLGSRSKIKSVRRAETRILRGFLPFIAANVRSKENDFRREYLINKDRLKEYTEESYVKDASRELVRKLSVVYRQQLNSLVEEKGVLASDPAYLIPLRNFSNLRKYEQTRAIKDFRINMRREPDGTNAGDLQTLVEIAVESRINVND